MTDRTIYPDPLATLGAHLSARRLDVELTAHGLCVTDPKVPGCCPEASPAAIVITCRPRVGDGHRIWFFAPGHEPIAESDQIMNAVRWILGRLASHEERQGTEEASR